jgi:hypothetical protein
VFNSSHNPANVLLCSQYNSDINGLTKFECYFDERGIDFNLDTTSHMRFIPIYLRPNYGHQNYVVFVEAYWET